MSLKNEVSMPKRRVPSLFLGVRFAAAAVVFFFVVGIGIWFPLIAGIFIILRVSQIIKGLWIKTMKNILLRLKPKGTPPVLKSNL